MRLVGVSQPYMGEDGPDAGAPVLRHHPDGKSRVFSLIVDRDTPGFRGKELCIY